MRGTLWSNHKPSGIRRLEEIGKFSGVSPAPKSSKVLITNHLRRRAPRARVTP
jgi:hypothetical protein